MRSAYLRHCLKCVPTAKKTSASGKRQSTFFTAADKNTQYVFIAGYENSTRCFVSSGAESSSNFQSAIKPVLPFVQHTVFDTPHLRRNGQKCKSNGNNPGLGFKVDANRDFYVDPDEAKIVRETFERYAAGETVADIVRDYNGRHLKTSKGKDFNKNSLHRMLQNKRYIGTYLYRDIEIPGGMPRIIDDDLFERVQFLLEKNKKASARTRGNDEYLLTTKLFCGHCLEMMTGYSGTGKSGKKYCYYCWHITIGIYTHQRKQHNNTAHNNEQCSKYDFLVNSHHYSTF